MKIAIVGAGNGGQAMAAHFALLGHDVKLYNRSKEKLQTILNSRKITLFNKINGTGNISLITDCLHEAIMDCELIMIITTADAHREIAIQLAPIVEENQIIVLNPGRTLGALDFSATLRKLTATTVKIAEVQSLIYACRVQAAGTVNIIGVKDKVLLAAYPNSDTDFVLQKVNSVYNCFIKAKNILHTSLENIGAILHPAVIILNAASIERGNLFYFYNEMTPAVAAMIEAVDNERLKIGKAFGFNLLSVSDWISFAYENVMEIQENNLLEKMRQNPAYYKIQAPTTVQTRHLLEDIPTGILPYIELAKLSGVECPIMKSIFYLSQQLTGIDFKKTGRTLENLGLQQRGFLAFMENMDQHVYS